jgi:hypothetical protein
VLPQLPESEQIGRGEEPEGSQAELVLLLYYFSIIAYKSPREFKGSGGHDPLDLRVLSI